MCFSGRVDEVTAEVCFVVSAATRHSLCSLCVGIRYAGVCDGVGRLPARLAGAEFDVTDLVMDSE